MNEENSQKILDELQRQTRLVKTIIFAAPIFACILLGISLVLTPIANEKMQGSSSQLFTTWPQIYDTVDMGDLETAICMTKELSEINPNDWYVHSYLGSLYNATGDNDNAEICYTKAYDLFPTKQNKEELEAVRAVLSGYNARNNLAMDDLQAHHQ